MNGYQLKLLMCTPILADKTLINADKLSASICVKIRVNPHYKRKSAFQESGSKTPPKKQG